MVLAGFALSWSALDIRSQMSDRSTLDRSLGFEDQQGGDFPVGWAGRPAGTISLDNKIVHSGKWAARLVRNPAGPDGFTRIFKVIPVDFSGMTIEYRGFLRTEDVTGFAGLFIAKTATGQFSNSTTWRNRI